MIKLKKVLLIALMLCIIGTCAYGYNFESLSGEDIKTNLEADYGINIIIPENEDIKNYNECLLVIDRGLSRFPEGVIKEITQYYSNKKIETNIILSKTEKISDLFSVYRINDNSADIFINTLQNSLYYKTCIASEEGFIHEIGHYISDYLFKVYGYDKIKNEFEKINGNFKYGTWGEGYDKVFVNKHSASSFEDEIIDLIWVTEVRPNIIRNINDGNNTIIHEKIKYLATVFDQSFSSITFNTMLWQDALPQNPDTWALEAIQTMKEASLIPEELDGIYNSYITKEDFYTLTFNMLEHKLGKDNYIKSFDLLSQDNHVAIDPINGEIFVDNNDNLLDINLVFNAEKEKRLYEALQMGLIDENWISNSKDFISRFEIAKLLIYISNELGMDISDYEAVNYNDLSKVKEAEKPFIYYVSSKGLIKGDGSNFNPFSNCTYQEAYIILLRFYKML